MTIPEIDLVLKHGTLGGRFTTLEGILDQIYEELSEKVFASGDSSIVEDRNAFEKFLTGLKAVNVCFADAISWGLITCDYRSKLLSDLSQLSSMTHWPTRTFRASTRQIQIQT